MLMRQFILSVFLSLVAPAMASILQASNAQLRDISVLRDKNAVETISSIQNAQADRFKLLPNGVLSAGYTRDVHWLRFTVDAPAGEWWLEILPPYLDDLRLYTPDLTHPGQFQERRGGDLLPFNARELPYRSFVYKLNKADDTPQTLYLRLRTNSSSILVPHLRSPAQFLMDSQAEYGLLMAHLGILLTVMALTLNTLLFLRESLSLWFTAFLCSLIVMFLGNSGFVAQYLFPTAPGVVDAWTGVGSLLTLSFGTAFYRRLFGVKPSQRILYWLYESVTWLSLLSIGTVFTGHYVSVMPFMQLAIVALSPIGLWLSYKAWCRHDPGGALLFATNVISVISYMVTALNVTGVLAGSLILLYGLQIGSLGTIVGVHLVLGSRYRAQAAERLQAQLMSIESERLAQHEHELRVQQAKFVSMLGHELRTSLSVLGMALGSQPMAPKAVQSSERAVQSMNDVIERTLQTEKLADSAVHPELGPCNLADMLQAAVANSAEPTRIQLSVDACPVLSSDARLLQIILGNLTDNALKYGAPDVPVNLTLTLQTSVSGAQHARVRVTNGIGRAGPPDAKQVFQKYYRAPQAHGHIGSGLGLHLASQMALLIGGELHYLPEPHQVVFELNLPLL